MPRSKASADRNRETDPYGLWGEDRCRVAHAACQGAGPEGVGYRRGVAVSRDVVESGQRTGATGSA